MKIKFFFLLVLFLGIGAMSFAQSASSAPADQKATTTQVSTQAPAKTGECTGHGETMSKADCKWVDANNDGICDVCNKKDCGNKPAAAPKAHSGCAYQKECGKASETCGAAKGGKK